MKSLLDQPNPIECRNGYLCIGSKFVLISSNVYTVTAVINNRVFCTYTNDGELTNHSFSVDGMKKAATVLE